MKLRPLLVPALLLTVSGGLVTWLLLSDPPEIDAVPTPDSAANSQALRLSDASQSAADMDRHLSSPQKSVSAAPLPGNIRNVSPEGVTSPKVSGSLKRIEPSKRYLELKNPPVEPIPDGPLELRRIQVLDSGHLKSGQLTITLAYIQPLKRQETCVSRLGGTWPCGARAQTFLRGLIRQFKVTCDKIEELGPQQILATCKRGKIDLGSRLVRYGWADVTPEAPEDLANLALEAKEKKIGKWQSEWLTELSVSNWDDDPTAALPGLEELTPEIVEWSLPTEPKQLDDQTLPSDPGLLGGFPEQ
ncbi:MAG: thermonuclease family protein [Roseibium sp.]|uniref:thermonuclease family protein n=1 Tax=Roseibium sp. TaxID=1936156 RepID=UPI00262DC58F|nr:thermonuclease family protein [Roseibium sp.]MCV0425799.1 thermonuclease family protein [Roseibium sp.]